jgi:hypothetical protein
MRPTLILAFVAASGIGNAAVAGSAIVIDNDRITVWDVHLTPGESAPETPRGLDRFAMFLEGGDLQETAAGVAKQSAADFGTTISIPRGTDFRQTLVSGSAHEMIVALKDVQSPKYADTAGLPAAFPRPGSVKVLETPRVVVWRFSWVPGQPTPMHFHDKDVVLGYRYDGTLKSVTPDGKTTVNAYKSGDIRFNKGDRAHYEELTTERQSAVMAELK